MTLSSCIILSSSSSSSSLCCANVSLSKVNWLSSSSICCKLKVCSFGTGMLIGIGTYCSPLFNDFIPNFDKDITF
eukprot:UN29120